MNLKEMGYVNLDWIHMAQDSDHLWVPVNTELNFRVP